MAFFLKGLRVCDIEFLPSSKPDGGSRRRRSEGTLGLRAPTPIRRVQSRSSNRKTRITQSDQLWGFEVGAVRMQGLLNRVSNEEPSRLSFGLACGCARGLRIGGFVASRVFWFRVLG